MKPTKAQHKVDEVEESLDDRTRKNIEKAQRDHPDHSPDEETPDHPASDDQVMDLFRTKYGTAELEADKEIENETKEDT